MHGHFSVQTARTLTWLGISRPRCACGIVFLLRQEMVENREDVDLQKHLLQGASKDTGSGEPFCAGLKWCIANWVLGGFGSRMVSGWLKILKDGRCFNLWGWCFNLSLMVGDGCPQLPHCAGWSLCWRNPKELQSETWSGNSIGKCSDVLNNCMETWLYVGRNIWNMFLDNSLGVDIWWHGASWCRNDPIDHIFVHANSAKPTLFVSDVQPMPVCNGQGFVAHDVWHLNPGWIGTVDLSIPKDGQISSVVHSVTQYIFRQMVPQQWSYNRY